MAREIAAYIFGHTIPATACRPLRAGWRNQASSPAGARPIRAWHWTKSCPRLTTI